MEDYKIMKKVRFISLMIAAFISVSSLSSSLAAPSPTPDNSTSTVTSADGTTKTVGADGNPVTSDTHTQTPQTDDDDDTETPAPTATVTPTPEPTAEPIQLEAGITMEDPTLTPPKVSYAQSALLMDMVSGRVLYSKNLDERVFPASLTKIMTGILALESGKMGENTTATYEALKNITMEDSQMGLLIGEEISMEQLVNSMLIHSANDASNVIAIHIAGSVEAFVELMNKKAHELGMTGTNYVNACGSHDDNHYTTARDLAILTKYAMQNEQFREIVKKIIYKVPPTNKFANERTLVNTNLFLSTIRSTYYYYPPAIGIKTGHTSQAGYCLVSAATYSDIELMAIVMNCQNVDTKEQAYSYIDSKNLFDFGFENYLHHPLAAVGDIVSDQKVYEAKDDMRVALTVENDVSALIPNKTGSADEVQANVELPEQLDAPIKKGDVLGKVSYVYKGIEVGSANLVATNDVERNHLLHVFHLILKVITSPFFFVPVIILLLLMMFARQRKKKRERQRRIQQLKRERQKGTASDNDIRKRPPNRNASRTQRIDHDTKGSNSRYRK